MAVGLDEEKFSLLPIRLGRWAELSEQALYRTSDAIYNQRQGIEKTLENWDFPQLQASLYGNLVFSLFLFFLILLENDSRIDLVIHKEEKGIFEKT